ncbi:hypothetical protein QVD17_23018 [Tagetes erecta]|uniref:Uncharacterized protein n=1 Tax=Tagetes erecta TaxID=13708 RepID=A0AAD8KDK1_TARER|nr:hypothetical protein QVD17_23018 [Tagetes erecta]
MEAATLKLFLVFRSIFFFSRINTHIHTFSFALISCSKFLQNTHTYYTHIPIIFIVNNHITIRKKSNVHPSIHPTDRSFCFWLHQPKDHKIASKCLMHVFFYWGTPNVRKEDFDVYSPHLWRTLVPLFLATRVVWGPLCSDESSTCSASFCFFIVAKRICNAMSFSSLSSCFKIKVNNHASVEADTRSRAKTCDFEKN